MENGKFNGIPWKIQWNSIEFHGIPLNFPRNSMGKYHEKIRQMFMKNSMEFYGNSMEFNGIPWNSMENSMN
jgi:hypothetical protein